MSPARARARTLAAELLAFAALAAFATAHWAGLVAGAPAARLAACVAIAAAAAVALALSAAVRPPLARVALGATCTVAAFGAGLVAVGVERRLLAPAGWGELADGLAVGFSGLASVEWPYDGGEPWTRLVLLMAVPAVLAVAAACSFLVSARGARPLGLVLLVALYGVAVTEHQVGAELFRGAVLLILVAAWLWLPRLPEQGPRVALAAAGAVLLAGLVALPAAARYGDSDPWIAYESWNPFQPQAVTRFDWRHSYGPIDWPRDGSTLLEVRSPERHYWRVETLDRFDGRRWTRGDPDDGYTPHLPAPHRADWETSFEVTIRELDTRLFATAGTTLRITGAEATPVPRRDGTVEALAGTLERDERYRVHAYVPDPSPAALRAAPRTAAVEAGRNTAIHLPGSDRDAGDDDILASPYGRTLRLARQLAGDQPTTYDAVQAVERHLRSGYGYSENPPPRDYPLAAFLFEDRAGYCQQFSGAMALMLRMVDIPARVVGGFSPGSHNPDGGRYRVRDFDAHSWVEVWFDGIGWVPFDPTPAVAPAESQSGAGAATPSQPAPPPGASGVGDGQQDAARRADRDPAAAAGGPAEPGNGGTGELLAAILLVLGLFAAAFAGRRALLGRGRPGGAADELEELRRVLARAGRPVRPGMTLRALEAMLRDGAGPAAARYVRLLRERRYAPGLARPPGRSDRRDLRRALARGRDARTRLALLVALSPHPFRRG